MGKAPTGGGATAFRFTAREVTEMEKALESSKGTTPARSVVLSLAENFSTSTERAGQKQIQWKQVWNWFQNRRHSQKAKIARSPDKQKAAPAAPDSQPKKVPASSAAVPSGPARSRERSDTQQMEFEAKSARDGAWYDVSTFISHRLAPSGDPEVRVRFAGFGSEEDEWVNVRSAVRQRSLPCEASECVAVLPGDLILCFQEGNEQALYFDADILDVQRRRHDVRGCRCRFWVRYRHDQSEEVVPLRKVCRRPETEYRLLKLQSYGKNPVVAADASQVSKSEPPPAASVEVAAGSAVAKGSETSLPAVALEPASVVAAPVTTSAMEVDPTPTQSAAIINSTVTASEQNPGATERVDATSGTTESVAGVERVGSLETISEPAKQLTINETPSLHAPPEVFNSELESIVVLDKSDLEVHHLAGQKIRAVGSVDKRLGVIEFFVSLMGEASKVKLPELSHSLPEIVEGAIDRDLAEKQDLVEMRGLLTQRRADFRASNCLHVLASKTPQHVEIRSILWRNQKDPLPKTLVDLKVKVSHIEKPASKFIPHDLFSMVSVQILRICFRYKPVNKQNSIPNTAM